MMKNKFTKMDAGFFSSKKAKNVVDAAHWRGFLTHLDGKQTSQECNLFRNHVQGNFLHSRFVNAYIHPKNRLCSDS